MKTSGLAFLACALLSSRAPASAQTLADTSSLSSQAAQAPSLERARELSLAAFSGAPSLTLAPSGSYRFRPSALAASAPKAADDAGPPPPKQRARDILGRKPGEEPDDAGSTACHVAKGAGGFLLGLLLGPPIGAGGVAYMIWTSKNETVSSWKAALILPGIILGAALGELVAPIFLAAWFSEARSYDPDD